MGLSGRVGLGVNSALQEQLLQQLREQQMQVQIRQFNVRAQQDQSDAADRRAARQEDLAYRSRQEARASQGDREDMATGTAANLESLFDPSSPIDPEVSERDAAALRGTRQQSRVQSIPTLEARPTVPGTSEMGPAGVGVRRLAPTGAQQKQRRVVNLQKRTAEGLAGAKDADARRAVASAAFAEGLDIPNELLKPSLREVTAAEEAERGRNFDDFTRRERFQDGLIRGRSQPKPVSPRQREQDRLNATRAARRDARAEFAALSAGGQLPSVDLDTLTEEYEDEYLLLLDSLETDTGGDPEPGAALDAGEVRSIVEQMAQPGSTPRGAPGRRVVNLRPRAPGAPGGQTIRYDAQGNRVP